MEMLASTTEEFADNWKELQEQCMRDAADLYLEPGLLGVDTDILTRWTK